MMQSRFTKERIIGILKEQRAGLGAKHLCCKHGVSDATVDKWKTKYGVVDVGEAKRLKAFEDKNGRLNKRFSN